MAGQWTAAAPCCSSSSPPSFLFRRAGGDHPNPCAETLKGCPQHRPRSLASSFCSWPLPLFRSPASSSCSGVCFANQKVYLLSSFNQEVVIRDAQIRDCWEAADVHCSSFFPEYSFPSDLLLRIDRYMSLLYGLSAPPGCMRTCLVAVSKAPLNSEASRISRDVRIICPKGNSSWSEHDIAGILTVDTLAEFLPRRGPLRQRRRGIAYVANVAVREEARRKGIARKLLAEAEERARSWGCRSIALHCDATNHAAMQLYKTWGFKSIRSPENAKWPQPKTTHAIQFNFMMKLLPKR